MIKVVGIRFKRAGKIYYFDPSDIDIQKNDYIIVETARGIEIGKAVLGIIELCEKQFTQPLKSIIRIASDEDIEQHNINKQKEKDALDICKTKIKEHKLDMKLIDVDYTFDQNKVIFYFTADGRIDFRNLVKDLAAIFKTRIELRQIGVRDETKMRGGIGICGRCLCCEKFLPDFQPVSIKMAKEQNLSLNPTKISGICGRLMCCLKYEQDMYEEINNRLPNIGDEVKTPVGSGVVTWVNVLRENIKVAIRNAKGEKELVVYKIDDIEILVRHKRQEDKDRDLKGLED